MQENARWGERGIERGREREREREREGSKNKNQDGHRARVCRARP